MRRLLFLLTKLFRAGLVFFLVTFITLEVALRVLAPFSATVRLTLWAPNNGFQYDFIQSTKDIARFVPSVFRPGSYHAGYPLNSNGFWTDEYTQEKQPGMRRIVAIGDSFTFSSGGVPLPKMWHQVAAAAIAQRDGVPTEAINLGLPGSGPRLARRVLQVEGVRLQPDIVVFGLFLGNDFTDEADTRPWIQRISTAARFLSSLRRLPTQLRMLSERGGLFTDSGPEFHPDRYVYDRSKKTFPDKDFYSIELARARLFTPSSRPYFTSLVEGVADVVDGMQGDAEAAGASFVVLLIPDEAQVNESLQTALEKDLNEPVEYDEVQHLVLTSLQQRGIHVIDTLPELRKYAAKHQSPYRLNDTHWDEAGNAIAGALLAQYASQGFQQ